MQHAKACATLASNEQNRGDQVVATPRVCGGVITLAAAILLRRKSYYEAMEAANKQNEITNWLAWFPGIAIEAHHCARRGKTGRKITAPLGCTCGWRIVISPKIPQDSASCYDSLMRNLAVVFTHSIAVLARSLGPGGVRSLVAESLLVKRQILILNRSRKRSPQLHASNRILRWLASTLGAPHSTAPFRNRSEACDTAGPS
jgi:hypothetical protein